MLEELLQEFKSQANPEKAKASTWFFKTGPGQYGEGDRFIGLTVPEQRFLARKYKDLPLSALEKLLKSPIHEHRLTGLFILIGQFQKTKDPQVKKTLFEFYTKNLKGVNNWDLVDSSAPYFGTFLSDKPRDLLYKLARSKNMWERRIGMMMTFGFIRDGDFKDALALTEILLTDKEDLLHKAVGWMLREVGKKDLKVEEAFLEKHYKTMPRTMLRYAIEKFTPIKKAYFMKKT